jgi:hypothetical protein
MIRLFSLFVVGSLFWLKESRAIIMLKNWFRDPITGSTVMIAFATVVNLLISGFLWRATKEAVDVSKRSVEISRKVFEAANRPYVGVENLEVQRNEATKNLRIRTTFKNFGSIPAYETMPSADVLLDNAVQESKDLSKPLTLMPGGPSISLTVDLSTEWSTQVLEKRKNLIITALAWYRDTVRLHTYCQHFAVKGDLSDRGLWPAGRD